MLTSIGICIRRVIGCHFERAEETAFFARRSMRLAIAVLLSCALLSTAGWPQTGSAGLDRVLSQMDAAAKTFRTTEASFVWDQYQKVIDETDTQKGKIYFRRDGGEIQMAADVTEPDKKYVLYSGGKVQVYQPKIDQVNEYSAGKNRSDIESFLVLGFGGSGHDLLKSYDVKYLGSETANGTEAGKLELIPKSARLKGNIARILLWIDPARGVSVEQQFFEPSGDYRLAKYSQIQVNQKLPDNAFKLKTTGKTRFISPQG
jgi:outer membrane lipoprotein-sorting protein